MVKDNVIRGVIIGIGLFFILIISLPVLLFETEYTYFSSPDNQEEFVVIERGVGKLYKLSDSRFYKTYITDIGTDDGYKPFADGAFELEWRTSPKELIIHYAFNYMNENNTDKYKEITIQIK